MRQGVLRKDTRLRKTSEVSESNRNILWPLVAYSVEKLQN
jgi:hypothetical protein